MSPQSAKTIRLQNTSFSDLSLMIHQYRFPASPGIRRNLLLTPINIRQGRYYDICLELSVTYEEACAVVDRSPEIKAFAAANALIIIHFPPAPEAAPAPVAAPEALPPPPPVVEVTPADAPPADAPLADAPPQDAPPVVDNTVVAQDPSIDWTEEDLRSYAAARRIDVAKAKSKTQVLRMIREANK